MFCGYAPEPLVRAVSERIARGNQFLLPNEDAIVVSEALAARFGLPKWQYTSSASQANTEAIRVARVATGRDKVLLFDGHYLGHFDQALVELDERRPERPRGARRAREPCRQERSWCRSTTSKRWPGSWNGRDVALVLTEPALTNNFGLILPGPGLPRRAARAHPGDGHAPGHRRDPHPGRRAGRAHRRSGASSPTS